MVYTPPVDSYLTRHSVTNLSDPFSLYLSYIIYTLQERNYELNTRGLLVNGNVFTPSDNFTTIDYSGICIEGAICMHVDKGVTGSLGKRSFDLQFSSDVPWHSEGLHYYGFARVVSFSYHLYRLRLRPIGCKLLKYKYICKYSYILLLHACSAWAD